MKTRGAPGPVDHAENPFERYDLDPRLGPAGITRVLRDRIEAAPDDAARDRIRAAWDALTMHPERRLRAALLAHPETRAPIGLPPPAARTDATPPAFADLDEGALLFAPELLALAGLAPGDAEDPPPPGLSKDPHLQR
jgi:hypothetical protein